MKRTFLKVLPFAAALLLATSCSKDDNNSTDEIVNNGGQQIETVVKTFKTLTVKGKVNKSISKVTTNDAGTALAFEGNEVFTFGNEDDDVYGTINFTKSDGSYTATINYTDEQYLNDNFTATLGENLDVMSTAYDNLAAAVQNAYYTIDFNIVQGEAGYQLQSENSSDIIVNLQSAFIKALSDENAKLGGEDITVAEGKYYVIPSGLVMGSGSSETVAGKVYKLGKSLVLPGEFSVSSSKKVHFSCGNLQATTTNGGTTWTWGFASNQYDYIGNATANTSINGNGTVSTNGTVDLFGWVGASSTWTAEGAIHGISNCTTRNSTSTYGNVDGESLKSDWGNVFGEGSPWFTLSSDEWQYLFNTRTTTSNIRYAKATVCDKAGVILLPDDWSTSTYSLQSTNTTDAAFTTNTISTADQWQTLEAAGAVFLPAAGGRFGASVDFADFAGFYWSSTAYGTSGAYDVYFSSGSLYPGDTRYRDSGFLVRLVRCMN